MKARVCDICGQQTGKAYLKVCRARYENKQYSLVHAADFCEPCFEKIIKTKNP